jgi:Uma2 family endonuclease
MGNTAKILPHYIYTDYVQWEGRWELINGQPFAMSPAPVPKHQLIAMNLSLEFGQQLKKCNKCNVYQPIDYLVKEDTIFQPDMLVVCGEIEKNYLDFKPALVAEVLSPATFMRDRNEKFKAYEAAGILYYLIIDPDREVTEVYEIKSGKYALIQKGKDISYSFNLDECTAAINFLEIW